MKFGKKKASYDARDFPLAKYLDLSKLPPVPAQFGHEDLIADWGMLANNNVGCCVWSSAAHRVMVWRAAAGLGPATFDDACVLSDYSACTGYDPNNPITDQGTDMHDAMKYQQQIGIVDTNGCRHKIGAYVWMEPGNVQHLLAATYLFGATDLGILFPNSAMDQINTGLPWSVVGGAEDVGGHCIPAVANRSLPECVTWGQIQPFTPDFYRAQNDEAVAIISEEYLNCGKTPEGFNVQELLKDLNLVRNRAGKKKYLG